MIDAGNPNQFVTILKTLAEEFGLRFITGHNITQGATGFHDPAAWIDLKVTGVTKLNCFIRVSSQGYKWVRGSQWSQSRQNKSVVKPSEFKYGRWTKGADGIVLDNGLPTELSRQVLEQWGTNFVNESYRAVLYENNLYNPVLMNLEFELNNTAERKTIALNAHVSTAFT